MPAFVDSLEIGLQSGKGGSGSVSFNRGHNRSCGAADGGDGGNGGSVYIACRSNLKTLSHLLAGKLYAAENGVNGSKRNCEGRRGQDLILEVPPGTLAVNLEQEQSEVELTRPGERVLLLKGGRGGKGNAHFSSSRLRSPKFAQPGEEGQQARYRIELNMMADFALVGFPNSGKSYLQKNLTNARPKVADYPFSSKVPCLGVLKYYDHDIIIADIPGILSGAAKGVGLGQRFLSHINRSTAIALLVDLNDDNFLQIPERLSYELRNFNSTLEQRSVLIIATKLDLPGTRQRLQQLQQFCCQQTVIGVSNFSGEGLEQLKKKFFQLADKT